MRPAKICALATICVLTLFLFPPLSLTALAEDAAGTGGGAGPQPIDIGDIPLIVPIPTGAGTTESNVPTPGVYFRQIFLYAIGLAALLALAQLTFGAVQYTASAGFPALQEASKGRMKNAIVGLILLVGAVTIITMFYNQSIDNLDDPAGNQRRESLNSLNADAYSAVKRLTADGILGVPENNPRTGGHEDFLSYFMDPRHFHWYDGYQDGANYYRDPDMDLLRTQLEQMQDIAEDESNFETKQQQEDYQKMLTFIATKIKSGEYNRGSEGNDGGIVIGTTPPPYGLTPEKVDNVLRNIDPKYIRSDLL